MTALISRFETKPVVGGPTLPRDGWVLAVRIPERDRPCIHRAGVGLRLCGRRKHTSVSLQDASLKFLQGFWLELVEFPVRDSGQPEASKREIHRGSQGGL